MTPSVDPAEPAAHGGVTVIVATHDRREEVGHLLGYLANQTLLPDEVIVVGAADAHLPEPPGGALRTTLIVSEPGSCRQRNVGLDAIADDCRLVVFLDDDYVPAPDAIRGLVDAFERAGDVVGIEGTILADGVTAGGMAREAAEALVRADHERRLAAVSEVSDAPLPRVDRLPGPGLYGCNMACRRDAVGGRRFDERLPLYGWQEDVDFAVRLAAGGGRLARAEGFRGVHRGVSRGRSPGIRLGYSQIANPVYLVRKGTLSLAFAARLMLRNVAANHLRLVRPEPWVDRAGRVRGNWRALRDFARGRLDPGRILEL